MFEKELEYYKKNKTKYLKEHKDKFLVLKDDQLLGVYESEEEGYKAGIEKYGNTNPFLIKKVEEKESPTNIPALYVGIKNASI